jgi:hypothetical protein
MVLEYFTDSSNTNGAYVQYVHVYVRLYVHFAVEAEV